MQEMQEEKIDVEQFIDDIYRLLPELLRQEPEFALVIKNIFLEHSPEEHELIRLLDEIASGRRVARKKS